MNIRPFEICFVLAMLAVAGQMGCTPPPSPKPEASAPPPPPAPAPPPAKLAPPPPKPEPDPHEKLIGEVNQILARYTALFSEVRDEASADKAAAEISQLSERLLKLAAELAKIPYKPEQDAKMQSLQGQLLALQTGQLNNEDVKRVQADPALAEKFTEAQLEFLLGVSAVAQAELSRRAPKSDIPAKP
jgi:hypothetical protein